MWKPETKNEKITYKTAFNGGTAERNTISRALLGKSCEVEKLMRFLKETKMFEEI